MSDVLTQPWPDCVVSRTPLPRELLLESLRRLGFVQTTTHFIGRVSWLNRLGYELVAPHCPNLDLSLRALIAAVSAHANRCRHCYGAVRAGLLLYGYDDATITKLQGEIQSGDFPPETKAALDFTRLMVIADPRYKEYEPILREAGLSKITVRELAYYVAITAASHRISTPLAIPPDIVEQLARPIFLPLTRLMYKVLFMWTFRRLEPEYHAERPVKGRFSEIVNALEGSPAAYELRGIIEDALKSTYTSARVKGLVYSVVARTIGADYAETQGRAMLAESGVSEDAIAGVLDHLRHTDFNDDELAIAGYARDTVRYQVPNLQNTLRALAGGRSQEETIDIVGQAAFANCIARMSMLVDQT